MVELGINGPDGDLSNLNIGEDTEIKRLELRVLEQFEKLSEIPRKSGYTKDIVEYLRFFALDRDLLYEVNEYTHEIKGEVYKGENIWIDLPATKGCEEFPPVILQAHTDMVAADPTDTHDFTKDSIEIKREGDNVTANGTTLGADNGIGMALMLAIADSNIPHGPIRLLFTGDEEVGFGGARSLNPDVLNADILINLDSEVFGEICFASAGGLESDLTQKYENTPVEDNEIVCKLSFDKLRGGHSGLRIHETGYLHGNVAMMGIFKELQVNDIPVRFSELKMGTARNAFPESSSAEIVIPADKYEEAKEIFEKIVASNRRNYPDEKNLEATFEIVEKEGKGAISTEATENIVDLFLVLPHGVLKMSQEVNGLVETSAYTGQVTLENGELFVGICARSSDFEQLYLLDDDYRTIKDNFNVKYKEKVAIPWSGKADSEIVQFTKKAFEDAIGVEPKLMAIHAGLECSIFSEKKEELKMVSLGPTITGVHSIDETLDASTVGKCAKVLEYMLEHINEMK